MQRWERWKMSLLSSLGSSSSKEPVPADLFERELARIETTPDLILNANPPNTDNVNNATTISSSSALTLMNTFEVRNLRLSSKDITRLSAALRSKGIVKLALVGTQILPSGMQQLISGLKASRTLKIIDLSDNPLGDQGIELLCTAIKFKTNVQELYLEDTKFTQEGARSLKEMLEINKKISVLNLARNFLGDTGTQLICQGILGSSLGDKSDIIKVDLSECEMGDEGAKLIGSVLASTQTLKELDLSGNRIGPMGAKFISIGLVKRHLVANFAVGDSSQVQSVQTGSAPYPEVSMPFPDPQHTTNVSQESYLMDGLETLIISDNPIGDEGVKHIAKRLPANGSVKRLFLKNVGMKSTALTLLCTSMTEAGCVEELHIGSNPIEPDTVATPIMNLLTTTSNLLVLDLSRIPLSLNDVKSLGDFLGHNVRCRLTHLHLADCDVNDDGAIALSGGIKFNMGLKMLDLTSNPFGPKGVYSFARTFKRSKNLEEFRVTGQSRIKAEGENYLAECLKYNKKLVIKGASHELDYMSEFVHEGKAFVKNEVGEIVGWSEEAWSVVKRGCGQIIGTVIYNLPSNSKEFREFKKNVLLKSRNVVNQTMFEHVIRHAEAPAMDVVSIFMNKCKIKLDDDCSSKASVAMSIEKRKSDDVTYRMVAKDCAKDAWVKEMAKNNRLFLGRYLTENGPAVHETHEIQRCIAKDILAEAGRKNEQVFVQIYENEYDFIREKEAREDLKEKLKAGGPFAIYDSILKDIELHEENFVASFYNTINDLRNSIANLGVTAGFDMHETVFLAKRTAQCLGTINNLGRIHGDFRPRNFVKVAKKRLGDDPLGRTSKKVMLPDKWVLFDLSKSVTHGTPVSLRMDSSYLPPEVARITFNSGYQDKALPLANEKMDVWCFGVVLFQLLTGVHLFHVEANTDRMYKRKERLELMNWINLDEKRQNLVLHRANEAIFEGKSTYKKIKESAKDLLNWCLQGDPHNRPTFNEILSHPFFVYRTNVKYTNVDLLLGWYQQIGSNKKDATHKNNRTHAHILNSVSKECIDICSSIKYYYSLAGCKVSTDELDWKLDIDKRKEQVQKARSLVILLTKGVFWKPRIMQKMLWAADSNETSSVILLDISSSGTAVEKFNFDEYFAELADEVKMDELVSNLVPISEKLDLQQINYGQLQNRMAKEEKIGMNFSDTAKDRSWLKNYLRTELKSQLMNLKEQVMPYRSRPFQTQAMINEMLTRTGFVSPNNLRSFNLQDNNKELATEPVSDSGANKAGKATVLILYNEESNDPKLLQDAQKLRRKMYGLENSEYKAEAFTVGNQNEVYKFFKKDEVGGHLVAENLTLVLCLVSPGFYNNFREAMLLLNQAKGLVSMLPILYGDYNLTQKEASNEILNLGVDSSGVLKILKDQRNYIPMPKTERNLEYEMVASMNYIFGEAGKQIELTKKNEKKDENNVYVRYERKNLLQRVY